MGEAKKPPPAYGWQFQVPWLQAVTAADVHASAVRVAVAITRYISYDTGKAIVAQETIAAVAQLSRRGVQVGIDGLKSGGFLTSRVLYKDGFQGRAAEYQIVMPADQAHPGVLSGGGLSTPDEGTKHTDRGGLSTPDEGTKHTPVCSIKSFPNSSPNSSQSDLGRNSNPSGGEPKATPEAVSAVVRNAVRLFPGLRFVPRQIISASVEQYPVKTLSDAWRDCDAYPPEGQEAASQYMMRFKGRSNGSGGWDTYTPKRQRSEPLTQSEAEGMAKKLHDVWMARTVG